MQGIQHVNFQLTLMDYIHHFFSQTDNRLILLKEMSRSLPSFQVFYVSLPSLKGFHLFIIKLSTQVTHSPKIKSKQFDREV